MEPGARGDSVSISDVEACSSVREFRSGCKTLVAETRTRAGGTRYPEILDGVLETEPSWKVALDLANKICRPAVGLKKRDSELMWEDSWLFG